MNPNISNLPNSSFFHDYLAEQLGKPGTQFFVLILFSLFFCFYTLLYISVACYLTSFSRSSFFLILIAPSLYNVSLKTKK